MSASTSQQSLKLSPELIQNFQMAKVFRSNSDIINSIDFFPTGEWMVSSSNDESITLYDCLQGKDDKVLFSKKYGVDLIRFTHDKDSVVCASKNQWDYTIRYMSLRSNTYIRYFKGHRDQVIGLSVSPTADFVLSSGLDTVRLWDLRTPVCQGLLNKHSRCAVQFDPQGLIFAAASGNNKLKMYDLRSYDQGPFQTCEIPYPVPLEWTDMKFSPDGKTLMVSASNGVTLIIDAYNYTTLHTFTGNIRSTQNLAKVESCYSPDGAYVLCGNDDGEITIYDAHAGQSVSKLKGHAGPVSALRFNPKFAMIASGCQNLCFWLPNVNL